MSDNAKDDPIVMYIVVRESLNMSIGKTAAQVGHGVQGIMNQVFDLESQDQFWQHDIDDEVELTESEKACYNLFKAWDRSGSRKVVLKANDIEWESVNAYHERNNYLVVDAGLTEIDPGTQTVIALFPMLKSQRSKILKRLQAL